MQGEEVVGTPCGIEGGVMGWISVKVRLPIPEDTVLAYCPDEGVQKMHYSAHYAPGIAFHEPWSGMRFKVTHWMPLPDQPDMP